MRLGGLALLALVACGRPDAKPSVVNFDPGPTPPGLARGDTLFTRNCQACHGANALGTDRGPPLVHIIYEPSHHSDEAFRRAVAQGAMAHHWSFGSMPPVPNVPAADVEEIIHYVRWLQQQAGIR